MKEFIKNIIPQIVFYTGAIIQLAGSKVLQAGLFLHMKFETKTGKKLVEMQAAYTAIENMLKQAMQPKSKVEANSLQKTILGDEPKDEEEAISGDLYVLSDDKSKN